MHDPREPHMHALYRILRYVKGMLHLRLHLSPSPTLSLISYTDADWGGCLDTRRSTSGYCVFLGDNLISWSSKRQPTLSRSSAEAEYRAVANVVSETCWLHNLLLELHCPLTKATLVYCTMLVQFISLEPGPTSTDQAYRNRHPFCHGKSGPWPCTRVACTFTVPVRGHLHQKVTSSSI